MSIYIALGSNQDAQYQGAFLSPQQTFSMVLDVLAARGITPIARSHIWHSLAWPNPSDPAYINAVISVETSHKPLILLSIIKTIETEFGRRASERNAPRPMDLDILDYNGALMSTDILTLPHAHMLARPFVMFPLAEIAPNWRNPVENIHIDNWTARLPLGSVAALMRGDAF